MDPLPPLFLSHGSPMTALEPRAAGAFFQRLGPALVAAFGRPQAILAVSAHTLTREPTLLDAARHEAIHDFGGFDPRLQSLHYDAPGAPALARRVAALMHAQSLPVQLAAAGGLDHGIWTPLRYLFPAADIPVLPLGWPPHWTPARLLELGRTLAPLAAEGVLVIGSGSITHNLRRVFAGGLQANVDAPATPESTSFRDWWAGRADAGDWAGLCDYRARAPHAALMHPTDEHLLPFFVAAGAAGACAGDADGQAGAVPARRLHASLTYGDLGMDAYAFGAGAQALAAAETDAQRPRRRLAAG